MTAQTLYTFIAWSIVTSLFIEGFSLTSSEGFILHPIRKWLEKLFANTPFYHPAIGCHICMSSLWGGAFYIAGMALFALPYWLLPVFVVIVAALNNFFYREL